MKYYNLFSFYRMEIERKNYIMVILILMALELLLAFSVIGYVFLSPISITLVHIAVIVAAMLLGPAAGGILGLNFGLTSIWTADVSASAYADLVFSPFKSGNPVGSLLLAIGTRVVFGVLTGYLYRWLFQRREGKKCGIGVCLIALVSIWIYSLLVCGTMELFFPMAITEFLNSEWELIINNLLIWIITVAVTYAVYWLFSRRKIREDYARYAGFIKGAKKIDRRLLICCVICSVLLVSLLFIHLAGSLDLVVEIEGIQMTGGARYRLMNVALQFVCAFAGVIFLMAVIIVWIWSYYRMLAYEAREEKLENEIEIERRANQAKTSFLSSMSHDMRTPLNAIIGVTDIAKKNLENPEKIQECLDEISISGFQLLALINNVLEMGKIESGVMELNQMEFSLAAQLEQAERIVRPRLEGKKQTLRRYRDWEHDWLKGDALRLYQVLANVLSNAVKYTPERGIIEFRTEEIPASGKERAVYRFIIADNGIGISPEFLSRIGEPFLREMESEQVRKTQGTGLGITITRHILNAMGGTIEFQSEPGKGTTVTIEIEFEQGKEKPEETGERQNGELTEKEIPLQKNPWEGVLLLVAEDNDLNWKIIRELLEYQGIKTRRAENGQICLERFRASEPGTYQAILMDIQMPKMNGLEAASAVRRCSHPDAETIPIIAMTANTFSDDVEAALKAGMNYHVPKPIDMELLLRTLTVALKK